MKKLLGLLFAVTVLVTLSACKKDSVDEGKFLKLAKDVEIASMDQHIATDGLSFEVISATIEGLYTYDKNGVVIPGIAESHTVSSDGTVYTFNLRDAKWENGDSVTADDFVFAWRRYVDPTTASEYAYLADTAGIVNAAEIMAGGENAPELSELGIEAVDSKTLKVTLNNAVPYFIQLMAFPTFYPLNEDFVTEQGSKYAKNVENLLANGPFKLSSWTKGYGFELVKNDSYYDAEAVKLDGLNYRVIKDHQTAALEYESNKLDVIKLTGDLVDRYKDNSEFTNYNQGYLWYIAINNEVTDKNLDNVNVRKAIAHAFNKEYIASEILSDGSKKADYVVPTDLAKTPDGVEFRKYTDKSYLEYDVAKAQSYWDQAKVDLGFSSLSLEIIYEDQEVIKSVAEYIQSQLQTNLPGLTVSLKQVTKSVRLDNMKASTYELGLTRWGPDYADPSTYLNDLFTTGKTYNMGNYSSATYDSLLESVMDGSSTDRWADMKEAERILLEDDAGVAPIFQRGLAFLVDEKVSGIVSNVVGTPFIYKYADISE